MGKQPKSSSKPKEGWIELRNKTQMAPNRKMKCEGNDDKSALHFQVLKGKDANNKDKSKTKRQTHPQLHPKQTPSKSLHAGPLCVRMGRLVSYLGLSGRLLLSCRRVCPLVGQCSHINTHTKGRIRMRSHPSLCSLPQLFWSYDGTQHCPRVETGPLPF